MRLKQISDRILWVPEASDSARASFAGRAQYAVTFTNYISRAPVGLVFAAFLLLCSTAAAQNDKVKGVINGRNGATMTVQTQDSGNVTVLLTDSTQVLEPEGVFRKKHLAMAALVPGRSVEVQGSYNGTNWSRTKSPSMAPTSKPPRTFKRV
jgi:hypothetical protein